MSRFLVVDDDRATVVGLTRLLTREGHHVTPFTAGAEAVEAIARESFDVILTDLEMPKVDGLAVVQAARARLPGACLIVVTGRADEHADALRAAGVCIIVDKPMDFAKLTASIEGCRAHQSVAADGACATRPVEGEPALIELRRPRPAQ
jgi:CheY-like chemotaxis protein